MAILTAQDLAAAAVTALTGERWAVTDATQHVPARSGLYAIYGDDQAWRDLHLLLCVSGRGTVMPDETTHTLERASAITLPAGVPHAYAASDDDPWSLWWLHVRGTDAQERATAPLGSRHPVVRLRALDRAVSLCDELVSTLESRTTPAHLLTATGIAGNLLNDDVERDGRGRRLHVDAQRRTHEGRRLPRASGTVTSVTDVFGESTPAMAVDPRRPLPLRVRAGELRRQRHTRVAAVPPGPGRSWRTRSRGGCGGR